MMTVRIVPIAEAHAVGFRACLDAVAREKRFLAQVEAPPLERVQGFVRDSVAADAAQFVAVVDAAGGEQVVGWVDIFAHWAPALAHCGRLGMGLLPDWRGQGLGERLLRTCLAKAWQRGITRVELEARADNLRAIALYRRCGFVEETIKRRAMRFDGQYFDALQMSLLRAD